MNIYRIIMNKRNNFAYLCNPNHCLLLFQTLSSDSASIYN
ncbi:hypothetical protein HMPREF9441_01807 [Paraprevotella clara YIT 11840]|uniref:Uncharacterized protein n=1 Tax=Paraprevotella clara YIT 11840 TaxID=762968 RepID=G5SR17_9BACT|nr:hypothetical protein HMPREF9441_01807 [Paraprevotella clara YIT 11840]